MRRQTIFIRSGQDWRCYVHSVTPANARNIVRALEASGDVVRITEAGDTDKTLYQTPVANAEKCQGCGLPEFMTPTINTYTLTFRDTGESSERARYCDICAEMINSGQSDAFVAAFLER